MCYVSAGCGASSTIQVPSFFVTDVEQIYLRRRQMFRRRKKLIDVENIFRRRFLFDVEDFGSTSKTFFDVEKMFRRRKKKIDVEEIFRRRKSFSESNEFVDVEKNFSTSNCCFDVGEFVFRRCRLRCKLNHPSSVLLCHINCP